MDAAAPPPPDPLAGLFDLSTVLSLSLEDEPFVDGEAAGEDESDMWSSLAGGAGSGPCPPGTISFPKLVLLDGKMALVEDSLLVTSLSAPQLSSSRTGAGGSTSPTSHSPRPSHSPRGLNPLNLRLVRGCGKTKEDGEDYFTMPSLRLTAVEKGYSEPLRDRNKNWAIDSQREVLSTTPRAQERPPLRLGQYPAGPSEPPPLMWAPALQSMVRRQQLLRTGWIVSDTHCIVEVFGVGVCGRVVATGQTKRLLIIEVLSTWNLQKYSIVVKVNQIKALFPGREYLFKAGKKKELVEALLDLLYFEYRVSYPSMTIDGRAFHPPVQVLTHTERADLPVEYPTAVCDVIRAISFPGSWQPPELLPTESPLPHLEQTLKISPIRRETAFSVRRRERTAQAKQDLIDKEEERRVWDRTPKRLRGLRAVRCVRRAGRIFVLQAYVFPMNPEIASLRGHAVEEVGRLRMRIALTVAGPLAGLSAPPQRWSPATVRMVSGFCLRRSRLNGDFHDGYTFFDFFGRRGGGAALSKPKHCFHRLKYLRRHSEMRLRLDTEDCTVVAGEPRGAWSPYQNNDMTSALGERSRRGKPSWKPQCKPRRDIGRGRRLVSRTRRFGDALGVYTAYQTSPATHGAIPESTEEAAGGWKKLNNDLAPQLSIEIEVYFPHGVTCSSLGVEPLSLPPFSTLRVSLFRSDICAMTRRLQQHHDSAFRATYLDFYGVASATEVAAAEHAWVLLIESILSAGRWAVQYVLPAPPPPPAPPIEEEQRDCSVDDANPSTEVEDVAAEPQFDFEMDESLLDDALGADNPLRMAETEVETPGSEEETDVDSLAWMGGHAVEDLLAQYCIADYEREYDGTVRDLSHSSLKLHIALGREAAVTVPGPTAARFSAVQFDSDLPSAPASPLITWRWSTIIFNKVLKMGSEAGTRLNPILQIIIWCIGREIGVVALDTERTGEVYFLRLADYIQDPLCVAIQNVTSVELDFSLEEMLKEVKYFEVNANEPAVRDGDADEPPPTRRGRGGLRFVEAAAGIEVEDAIVDNDDDMMDMVQMAEEAAKKRAEASAAMAAAKKEKAAKDAERKEKEKLKEAARKRAHQLRTSGVASDDEEDGDDDVLFG